jgi:hypothetical protein
MGDSLKIQIIVDGSQVPAGMNTVSATVEAATARIKAAFGSVENAPAGLQTALSALQSNTQLTQRGVTALSGALNQMVTDAEKAAAASAETATKMTGMERAMATASGRIAGMASGAGMLGGALGRVAAASSVLGPILAAAFPVIAIVALVDILGLAYDKIIEFTSGLAGWDKEAQHLYDQLIQLNQQTIAFNANLAIEKLRLNEIGLKGTNLDLQKQADLKAELAIRSKELTDSQARENDILKQLAGTSRTIEVLNPRTRTSTPMTIEDKPDKDEVTRLNKELQEARANTQKLWGDVEKLKQVSIPAVTKEEGKDRAAEAERAAEFNEKLIADTKRLAEEDLKALDARKRLENQAEQHVNRDDSTDQDFRDMRLRDDADEASTQARLGREKEASITGIEIEQEKVKELARLGQITSAQEVQRLNELEAQKLEVEKAYIQQRIDAVVSRMADDDAEGYKKDKAELDKLLGDKQKAEDTYLKNRQKNIDGAANTEQRTWTQLMSRINSAFDQSIQGLIRGTMTFGKAFASLLDNLLSDFVSFLARKVEKWAEEQLLELALHSTFLTNLLGLETAGNAAKTAEGAAAASFQVTQQAGIAGAASFASVMASLPFPLNVATAPGVMAAAIATTLGNLSLASAAGGYDVPKDMLAMVHANEMILPANLSAGLKDLIGSGGGGTPQITVNYNGDFSAIDSKGMEDALARNAASLTKVIRRELRRTNSI